MKARKSVQAKVGRFNTVLQKKSESRPSEAGQEGRFYCTGLALLVSVGLLVGCQKQKFTFENFVSPQTPASSDLLSGDPEWQEESFYQKPDEKNMVDILVVVDNSASMEKDQKKMAIRFKSFISGLDNVNWRLAITTTDVEVRESGFGGQLVNFADINRNYIDADLPNAEELFLKNVLRQESIDCRHTRVRCGSSSEQPLQATVQAILGRDSYNSGFFRDEAHLALVIISDEDEMSDAPRQATTPTDVLQIFQQEFNHVPNKQLKAYGLIIEPGDRACYQKQDREERGTFVYYGTYVSELAKLTGGGTGSICDDDYSTSLSEISRQVAETTQTYELNQDPEPNHVRLRFTPRAPQARWEVRGRKLIFTTPPAAGTRVEIIYRLKRSAPRRGEVGTLPDDARRPTPPAQRRGQEMD